MRNVLLIHLITGLTIFLISLTGAAAQTDTAISVTSAETVTPLVELYTSEGCSSCPPADRFLAQLGEHLGDEIQAIPLAFHVDYWNWLGWVDPFSSKQYTNRQHEVAKLNQQRNIYTPEWVVNGKEARGGGQIYDSVREQNKKKAKVSISFDVTVNGLKSLSANVVFNNDVDDGVAQGHIAIYENGIVRKIKGGENKGETLRHEYVVRYWSEPFRIDRGSSYRNISIDIGGDWNHQGLGLAVVVVDGDTGSTLQAASTSLNVLYNDKVVADG